MSYPRPAIERVALPIATLMEMLTTQILRNKITVDEARQIVLRREFYRDMPIFPVAKPRNMRDLERMEMTLMVEAANRHQGNLREAAKEIGMAKSTMYRKLRNVGYYGKSEVGRRYDDVLSDGEVE
jgi:transcriptional regulator of acetoin/glycerol metabolism